MHVAWISNGNDLHQQVSLFPSYLYMPLSQLCCNECLRSLSLQICGSLPTDKTRVTNVSRLNLVIHYEYQQQHIVWRFQKTRVHDNLPKLSTHIATEMTCFHCCLISRCNVDRVVDEISVDHVIFFVFYLWVETHEYIDLISQKMKKYLHLISSLLLWSLVARLDDLYCPLFEIRDMNQWLQLFVSYMSTTWGY